MRNILILRALVALALPVIFCASSLHAQQPSQDAVLNLANKVRKEILTLSNYGVFDHISFNIGASEKGYAVTLKGYASRPTLKSSAENVVKKIEGVDKIVNEIETLPTSRQDEDIRLAAYLRIYGNNVLSRYNPNRGAPLYGSAMSWRRVQMMGISNDPPPGAHPISIVVKNGNIILEGVVDNEGDKNIAGIVANGVSGAFSVTNNLVPLHPSKKKEK
jgi:hyperosmotically inducible periplasmic protein